MARNGWIRVFVVLCAGLGTVLALQSPVLAKGGRVDGTGNEYYLNDSWSGVANRVFNYGNRTDELYVGDWNADGVDSLAVRRGRTFYVRNSLSAGNADRVFNYGREGDVVYVGDWDGNNSDTLAVRRGSSYLIRNSLTAGPADRQFYYGQPNDVALVGDWDGDGKDTLAVRRGNIYYIKNTLGAGPADRVINFGRANDQVYVGDWNGDGRDTLAVRRGNVYYIKDSLSSGAADRVVSYGRATDATLVGDWNRDGRDSLGVRRDPWGALLRAGGLTGRVPYSASGNLSIVPGSQAAPSAARVWRVRVEVENGLPVNGAAFASVAMNILNDPRGWGSGGGVSFARTSGTADIRLILASPTTVDRLCAPLNTRGYTSCRVGDRTVINAQRWEGGAAAFNNAGGSIGQYREYVVNHEVGHALGYGHRSCPGPGQLAPVMVQQTLNMGGCRPNGWPNP